MPPEPMMPRILYLPISLGIPIAGIFEGSGILPFPESSLGIPMVSASGSVGGWLFVIFLVYTSIDSIVRSYTHYNTIQIGSVSINITTS
jgi:hypothetical protein